MTDNSKGKFLKAVLPVMFGFFIMGFVDIVGIATNYVKADFSDLDDTMSSLISISCFLWFLLLSVPTGMLMNRIGRRRTVLASFGVTAVAMTVPAVSYTFPAVLVAFALTGIGNTMLQVALNPLVTNVVQGERLTGTLTLGQFVKAISSFLGPVIVTAVTGSFLGWRLVFPIYAAVSLTAMLWLALTPIKETPVTERISLGRTFSLLKDKYILAFFIGILALVGVDVGMGISFPKLLEQNCCLPLEKAGLGNSAYFLARTAGAFLGGILLMNMPEKKFYAASTALAFAGLLGLIFSRSLWLTLCFVTAFGLGYANLFSIIFSVSMKKVPEKANEVSSLLVMGIAGGGIVPPVLGLVTDSFWTQTAAVVAMAVIWTYLFFLIRPIGRVSK